MTDYAPGSPYASGLAAVQARARAWLVERDLLVPGEPPARTMQRCAAFRAALAGKAKPGPLEWAREVLRQHAAGLLVQPYCVRVANDALGRHEEPELRAPARPVPRPDAKERQAGDVEVAF